MAQAAAARTAASPLGTLTWGSSETAIDESPVVKGAAADRPAGGQRAVAEWPVLDGQVDVAAIIADEPRERVEPEETIEAHEATACREAELARCA